MKNGHILITGSNGGVGLYVTEYLLKNGFKNLICHYRNSSEKISKLLEQYDLSPKSHLAQANLSDEESITKMGSDLVSRGIFINRILNIAGSSKNGMSWKLTGSDFRQIIESNLISAFLTSKEFLPKMREQGFGRIVNFTSIVGFTGVAGASHYCAAKAGLVGLTKSMALELANKGITSNAIALGYFDTGLIEQVPANLQEEIKKKIPLGRFGSKEDIGAAAMFLLSESSGFITGQVLHLNGGQY